MWATRLNIVDWELFQDSDFAESEITSLDAGLRMDGLLTFYLWDLVFVVLRTHGISKLTQASTGKAALPSTVGNQVS